jgi:hypothetical protein
MVDCRPSDEIYPYVPRPAIEETRLTVEIYPREPRPMDVLVKFVAVISPPPPPACPLMVI